MQNKLVLSPSNFNFYDLLLIILMISYYINITIHTSMILSFEVIIILKNITANAMLLLRVLCTIVLLVRGIIIHASLYSCQCYSFVQSGCNGYGVPLRPIQLRVSSIKFININIDYYSLNRVMHLFYQ